MKSNNDIKNTVKKTLELLSSEPACSGQARQVKQLLDKLEEETMTVSVIGQFKRGKSSLANGILEDEILPVGIVPITSAVTRVVYGKKAAEVHFINGAVENVAFEQLSKYISEQENSNNKLGVSEVILHTPSKFLKKGLTFVDTPGVGSFHKNNTEVAYQYMKESDAVIFLLSVDSPINQIEIDFLYNTREYAGKFYFAVNKIDAVEEKDLQDYIDYCSKILCQLMETESVKLFPVSGKTGEGIDALKETIYKDAKNSAEEILKQSTVKKLKDVISHAVRQLDFYWKAMNMEYKELDERFAAINAKVAEVKEKAASYEGLFEIHLNEIKIELSEKIYELFGMEYHYDIESLPSGLFTMDKESFINQVDAVCQDLNETLKGVLLYREENAYTVVRRISKINDLTRRLRKINQAIS